jgi:apolipoprotein N-acyltransferase
VEWWRPGFDLSFSAGPGILRRVRWGDMKAFRYGRELMAVCGGLIWAFSFPNPGIASLGWLAPGFLLGACMTSDGKQAFRLGFLAGLACHLWSISWLLYNPFFSGALAGWFFLSVYLALYPALWVWSCFYCAGRKNGFRRWVQSAGWLERAVWGLFCATSWTALEMLRARFLSGFPWNFLGVSQYANPPLIQIASIAGVYGVSFVLVWFSTCLFIGISRLTASPLKRWAWLADVAPVLAVTMAVFCFGLWRIAAQPPRERSVQLALIQPSIPQTLIWDSRENTNRFLKLIELSKMALALKPDILIWPEAGVPTFIRYDVDFTLPLVTNLAREHRTWIILGSDDAAPRFPGAMEEKDYDVFNSAFLFGPDGRFMESYRKQQLVIFGEYVPLARWLPFLNYLTPIGKGFTPGKGPVPFVLPSQQIKTSVLICYEDVFPHVARLSVEKDTDFLVNLTNDGWFGESSAQWQQAANSAFRAVENGLPLVRCANNGLTCWIDPAGQMHEVYFGDSKDVYGAGFKMARIPLLSPSAPRVTTFYRDHGDVFGWGCAVYAMGYMGVRRQKRFNLESGSAPA